MDGCLSKNGVQTDESIEVTMKKILEGCFQSRIKNVVQDLKAIGVQINGDLKHVDWNVLNSVGSLTDMEIKKIMGYVRTNYPKEYEEHKKRRDEDMKLKRETELLNYKAEKEEELQREEENYRRQMSMFEQNRTELDSNSGLSDRGASSQGISDWMTKKLDSAQKKLDSMLTVLKRKKDDKSSTPLHENK